MSENIFSVDAMEKKYKTLIPLFDDCLKWIEKDEESNQLPCMTSHDFDPCVLLNEMKETMQKGDCVLSEWIQGKSIEFKMKEFSLFGYD